MGTSLARLEEAGWAHENPVGRVTDRGWEQVGLIRARQVEAGSIWSQSTLFPYILPSRRH